MPDHPPARRMLTRRGWSLAGACLGLFVAGRLLGTVELSILATGGVALLAGALVWARTRSWELVAQRELRPARLHVGADGRVDLAISNRGAYRTPQLSVTDVFDNGRRAARSRPTRPRVRHTESRPGAAVAIASGPWRSPRPTRSVWPGGRGAWGGSAR
jgi:hypothetical protein